MTLQRFMDRDLMSHKWWARCPHGCGWETTGHEGSATAWQAQREHVDDCPARPGPEPPPPVPPPPARPA